MAFPPAFSPQVGSNWFLPVCSHGVALPGCWAFSLESSGLPCRTKHHWSTSLVVFVSYCVIYCFTKSIIWVELGQISLSSSVQIWTQLQPLSFVSVCLILDVQSSNDFLFKLGAMHGLNGSCPCPRGTNHRCCQLSSLICVLFFCFCFKIKSQSFYSFLFKLCVYMCGRVCVRMNVSAHWVQKRELIPSGVGHWEHSLGAKNQTWTLYKVSVCS